MYRRGQTLISETLTFPPPLSSAYEYRLPPSEGREKFDDVHVDGTL